MESGKAAVKKCEKRQGVMMDSKLIEFMGMPRSGKTTQINFLKKKLLKKGFSVKVLGDRVRAARIQTPPAERIAFELIYFSKALEEYFRYNGKYDYILMDRGPNDSTIWFDIERILGNCASKRTSELKKTYWDYRGAAYQTFCMMIDVEMAIIRHSRTKHMKVDDLAMSKKYLTAIHKAYLLNRKNFHKCTFLNGNDSKNDVHKAILQHLHL
ncbi:MAG: hypothetical protein HN337_01560 [Deltaproteobacteria bacterium]|nr:hypothetical protein [Deltaproteobacteria bacterium]